MSPNSRGAALMVVSMVAFTLNDTCIKLIGDEVPLFQLITLRGLLASALIAVLAWRLNAMRFDLSARDWAVLGVRGSAEAAATWFFLTALFNMPLANVTAVLQALPLTVTLGAAVIFREQVGWRRSLAILAGFCGMLLIVRPGPDGFSLYALYALAAVACVTLRDLVTRAISKDVPSLMVTLVSSVVVLGFAGTASITTAWQPVSNEAALLLIAASGFIIGGYLFSVLVMREGDVSFTAPFRYSGLLAALILGWLVFDDWPDQITLLGALIVVASGLFALYRERVRRA